jgi:transcriptional regulator NrdR family protein
MSIKQDNTGITCPTCGERHTKVIGGFTYGDGYVRQRRCLDCGRRFKTVESYGKVASMAVKGRE